MGPWNQYRTGMTGIGCGVMVYHKHSRDYQGMLLLLDIQGLRAVPDGGKLCTTRVLAN